MTEPAPPSSVPGLQMIDQRQLFITPLSRFMLNGHEDLNNRLMTDITALRQQSPGMRSSNQHGWHSERDFYALAQPSFQELRRHFATAIATVVAALNPKLDRTQLRVQMQGWINVSGKGAYNTPHDHPHYLLSGVYYVQVPPRAADSQSRSGDIEFLDSRGLSLQAREQELYLGNAKYRLRPEPGMLLIFPATLQHWVYPHEEEAERVSIAFNMRIAPPKP